MDFRPNLTHPHQFAGTTELRGKDVRSLLKMFQDDTPKKDGEPKKDENVLTLENMISEQWLDGKIKQFSACLELGKGVTPDELSFSDLTAIWQTFRKVNESFFVLFRSAGAALNKGKTELAGLAALGGGSGGGKSKFSARMPPSSLNKGIAKH
ncbi:MAG: hypothetical protein GY862_02930 [Gammaproteobacteria bacterium]|nr:hypothetical protein [Gammaproteobacteria bacterium]